MDLGDELDLMGQDLETLYRINWSGAEGYTALNLHDNKLTTLEGLPVLRQLTELNISSNKVSSCDLPELSQLTCLTSLDLSGNKIVALGNLPYLPTLQTFSVAFNFLDSLFNIDALPNLKELDIRGNQISKSSELDCLVDLQQLRSLQVTPNPVCQQMYTVYRLFEVCVSLQDIDGQAETSWRGAQTQALAVALDVPTPRVDQLVERFKSSHRLAQQQQHQHQISSPPIVKNSPLLGSGSPRSRYYSPTRSHVLFPNVVFEDETSSPRRDRPTVFVPVAPPTQQDEDLADHPHLQFDDHPPGDAFDEDVDAVAFDDSVSEERDHPPLSSIPEAAAAQLLMALHGPLQKMSTVRMARAFGALHRSCQAARHVQREQAVAAEWEKRLLQEKQRFDYISRKNIANEMLAADLRRQVQQLEQQLTAMPPPPPSPPAQAPAPALVSEPDAALVEENAALQGRVREAERQMDGYLQSISALNSTITSLAAEASGLRSQLADKELVDKALSTAQKELDYSKDRLTNSDTTVSSLQSMVATLNQTVLSQDQALRDKDSSLRELGTTVQQLRAQLSEQETGLRDYELTKQRLVTYDAEVSAMRAQLADAEKRLGEHGAHNTKLEERLTILTSAYNDINQMNAHYVKEVDKLKAKHAKAHETVKELSRYVKQLEDVLQRHKEMPCEACAVLRQDLATASQAARKAQDELSVASHLVAEYKAQLAQQATRDAMRSEQLAKLEATVKEIEDHKSSILSSLHIKEAIVKDQMLELTELKRKHHTLERDFTTLQTGKETLEYRCYVLEKDVHRLQTEVESKATLEGKLHGMVAEYLQFSEQQEGRRVSHRGMDLVEILDDIQGSAMHAKASALGREVCTNPRCQEQVTALEQQLQEVFDKLQRQKREFDSAYANKVDECKRFADALAQLESKSRELGTMIEGDKRQYEETVAKLRGERKKLTKLCRVLEEELRQKERELLTTQQASKDLQEAFASFQKLAAKSNRK